MTELRNKKIDDYVAAHRQEILDDLAALVRIPSVAVPGSPDPYPFGENVAKVLDQALVMADEKGMRTENHGYWYGLAKTGNGPHTIGLFSHLDVVETDDRWIYPPFEMTTESGYVIGRGVNDDKLAAVIGLHVGKAMQELDIGKNIEFQLYLGCCEEKGMSDLERYKSEQEQPEFSMVPDFLFPVSVSEPGSLRFSLAKEFAFDELNGLYGETKNSRVPLKAGILYTGSNQAEMAEKVASSEHITCAEAENGLFMETEGRSPSGFGATDGINAIEVLLEFLSGCGLLPDGDAAKIKELKAITCGNVSDILGIRYSHPFYGTLSCSCMKIACEGNALTMSYVARVPGSCDPKTQAETLKAFAEAQEYQLSITSCNRGSCVDPADPRVLLVNQCCNEVRGKNDPPRVGGGTYAGRLKNAVAFGPKETDAVPFLPAGHGMLHGPDEAMNIEDAMNAVRIYIRAVAALDEFYGRN